MQLFPIILRIEKPSFRIFFEYPFFSIFEMGPFSDISKIPYRVILCKFNEISLKSPQYQKKIVQILINSIKKICLRESLHLQSALNLKGRLLFFFPSEEIPLALPVFRHIIGIQSIAPAISVSRNFETLKPTFIDFALKVLKDGESFAIKFKSIVPYPIKAAKVKNDLYTSIRQSAKTHGKKVTVKSKGAVREFTIEVREKGTYLYVDEVPTLWGGLPIETSNALLCPWSDAPEAHFSAKLLLRRGAIITPVIFDPSRSSQTLSDSEYELPYSASLHELAKYYSEDLPVIIFRVQHLVALIDSLIPKDHSPYPYYYVCFLRILETNILRSRDRATTFYGERKLHYRGFISVLHAQMTSYLAMGQNLAVLQFIPQTGFSPQDLQALIQKYLDEPNEFSFNYEVLLLQSGINADPRLSNQSSFNDIPHFLEIFPVKVDPKAIFPSIQELSSVTSNKRIKKAISSVVHNKDVKMMSGRIFAKK